MVTAKQLIGSICEAEPNAELAKLNQMSLTALQGIWRRMEIGPISDRPKDRESMIDDIMHTMFGDDWRDDIVEVTPPGWEPTVKAMKKHPEIDNPWALAWSMKNKGYTSNK